jgi:hypothetical protein
MAHWSDLATWRGPTPNQSGPMIEIRGLVVHIAAGFFEGTISWQKNPSADVSSHFVNGREWGQAAQMVDTSITAWTQGAGNGRWISSENEGFLLGHRLHRAGWHELSPWQIEINARYLARLHREHGVPLKLATSPWDRGLAYHSLGAEHGVNWGHPACPGEPIKRQLPLVLARAKEIVNGDDGEMKTTLVMLVNKAGQPVDGRVWHSNGQIRVHVADYVKNDASTSDEAVLGNLRWVAGAQRLGSLIDNGAVWKAEDLDAFGIEIPGDLAARLSALDTKLDRVLTALQDGVTVPAQVSLTPESITEVAVAVVNEDHKRSES